jgi:hypothetical protein
VRTHRAQPTASALRLLAVAAAVLAAVIAPTPARAAGTDALSSFEPAPELRDEPDPTIEAAPSDEREEEGVTSSTMRGFPNLTVIRAHLRHGRLRISAVVTSGATGKIRGRAHFGRGTRRFTARIDSHGMIYVDKRLRGARRASSARVHLAFRGNGRFLGQSLTLRVASQSTQLRVLSASS